MSEGNDVSRCTWLESFGHGCSDEDDFPLISDQVAFLNRICAKERELLVGEVLTPALTEA